MNILNALLLFTLCAYSSIFWSQEARLSVQTGHSATIKDITYNADGSLIASCAMDNNVAVWHPETGKQYASFSGHTGVVMEVAFHPTKNILYSVSLDSTLIIWDLAEAKMMNRVKFNQPLGAMDIDAKGEKLVLVGEFVEVYDLTVKKSEKFKLSSTQLFTTVRFSNNGKWLAVGGENEQFVYVVDPVNKEIVGQTFSSVNDLVFEENDHSIYGATENGGIVRFDFYQNKVEGITNKSEWNSFNGVRLTSRYLIGTTDNAEVVVFDRRNYKKTAVLKAHLKGVKCVDVEKSGRYMTTAGEDKRIILWDLDELQMIRTLESSIYRINQIDFSADGEDIIIGFSNGAVRRTNLLSNNSIANRPKISKSQLKNGWQYFLTGFTQKSDHELVFDLYLFRSSVLVEGAYDYLREVKLFWNTNLNQVFLQETGKKSNQIKQYEQALRRGTILPQTYFMNQGHLNDREDKYSAQVSGQKLTVRQNQSNSVLFSVDMNHTDKVTSVAINPQKGFVATAGWDGMIKFWSLEDGKLLLTYGAFGADDFVYISPDNYYFASKGALENIGFVLDNQMFAFDQFDLVYNRPDLVFKALPYVSEQTVANYYRAYTKRLSKLGVDQKDLKVSSVIPKIDVVNKTGSITTGSELQLNIKATDEQFELQTCHVLINGVPIFSKEGKPLEGDSIQFDERLKLNPGENFVQVYVTNQAGISSFKRSFEVTSKPPINTSNLYVVAMGCSKYQQAEYNLNFAEKDANDVAKFFSKTKYFDEVFTQKLVNEAVTKSNLDSLVGFLKNVKENDVVMLFVAGHGVLDADLDYYIAAHDMDFKHPEERGIPISFFDDLLDGTKSRKKIMFIDACHSGEIDKSEVFIDTTANVEQDADLVFRAVGNTVKNVNDVNAFELSKMAFADMRESNGATVISSAGGGEFAMEGKQWSNGVFTYSLLKGLKSRSADLNKDKVIMVSELHAYLIENVNRITRGRQTPTSRVENLNNDFRIQ